MSTTPNANPWQPPLAPALTEAEGVYRIIMTSLAIAARSAENVQALAAVVALFDAQRDLMLASGVLWQSSPDMVAVLRSVADDLEQLRKDEPRRPLLETLKETIASGRPKFTH